MAFFCQKSQNCETDCWSHDPNEVYDKIKKCCFKKAVAITIAFNQENKLEWEEQSAKILIKISTVNILKKMKYFSIEYYE